MDMGQTTEINTQAKINKKEKKSRILSNPASRKQEWTGSTESTLLRQIQQVPTKNQGDSHQDNHQPSSKQSPK